MITVTIERKLLEDIVWATSSYGVCKECCDKLSNEDWKNIIKNMNNRSRYD